MTFAVKKQRKPYLIWPEEKNGKKDKFLDSGADQKKEDDSRERKREREKEREREKVGGETRNHASPTFTFPFSALKEATNP